MQSFLRRGAERIFSSSTSSLAEGPATASSPDSLFPKVNPAVDGADCYKDCASCTIHYPAKFDVEVKDKLYGKVDAWATHVLVATGKTDWVRDVSDEEGSVMEAIGKGSITPSNGKLKLSASNIPVPDEYHEHEKGSQPTTVLLLPAFIFIDHVTPPLVPDLIQHFINRSVTTTTPLNQKPERLTDLFVEPPSTPLTSRPCPHAAVILLCSQKTRDARCGQSAPLLRREFERHLRHHGLYRDLHDERPGGVGVYFISHVGGHKYSANCIIYRRRDFDWYKKKSAAVSADTPAEEQKRQGEEDEAQGAVQGIWLARVRPEECENIVKFTVLQGKVVKPEFQLRGGFDREKGVVSW